MLDLTVKIKGKSTEDLLTALEEVRKLIEEGYTSGFNGNESGKFIFDTVEYKSRQRPATAGNDQ